MFKIFKRQAIDNRCLQEIIKKRVFPVHVQWSGESLPGSIRGAVNILLGTIRENSQKFRVGFTEVIDCRSCISCQRKII